MLVLKALRIGGVQNRRLLVDKDGFLYHANMHGKQRFPVKVVIHSPHHQYGVSTYFRGKNDIVVDLNIMVPITTGPRKGGYVFSGRLLKKWFETTDSPEIKYDPDDYTIIKTWFDNIPDDVPVLVVNEEGNSKSFPNKSDMMNNITDTLGKWTVYQMSGQIEVELPIKPIVRFN